MAALECAKLCNYGTLSRRQRVRIMRMACVITINSYQIIGQLLGGGELAARTNRCRRAFYFHPKRGVIECGLMTANLCTDAIAYRAAAAAQRGKAAGRGVAVAERGIRSDRPQTGM